MTRKAKVWLLVITLLYRGWGKTHLITGLYFLTLTASRTHTIVSGRKYTPVTRYTSSEVRVIQIEKSDGKVSQNDRNCLFLPWSLLVRMICCSLPLALMRLGPILHSFQDGILIGLGFSCIIWRLIIDELNFIGKIVHQWSKETASFSSY